MSTSSAVDTKNIITLKGSVAIVSDFFFCAINSILYQRGEYEIDQNHLFVYLNRINSSSCHNLHLDYERCSNASSIIYHISNEKSNLNPSLLT